MTAPQYFALSVLITLGSSEMFSTVHAPFFFHSLRTNHIISVFKRRAICDIILSFPQSFYFAIFNEIIYIGNMFSPSVL